MHINIPTQIDAEKSTNNNLSTRNKWCCRVINNLKINGDVRERDDIGRQGFSDIMTIHFNMLGMFMEHGICSNLNSTNIVSMKRLWIGL